MEIVGSIVVMLSLVMPAGSTIAVQLKEAHVTQIIKDVQLLPAQRPRARRGA